MPFSSHDVLALDDLLREAARVEILPRFKRLDADAVRHKASAHDLVTDADEAAEAFIAERLRERFPGAVIVGEEGAERDPRLLDSLADAELAFVLDPVDGTRNFVAGLPLFGVMAAVVSRGEVIAGVIHDPIGRDSAVAVSGEGAFMQHADGRRVPLRVGAPPASLADASACVLWHFLPDDVRPRVTANLARIGTAVCHYCAAHEFRMLAAGHCDFLFYSKLMPWDIAAGWLLHREAGGYAARADGTPYNPASAEGWLIGAPDEASWHLFRDGILAR
ncbi:MAG TPA: inositol monophosphatase [Microvirga sp.]|nr:inositol monophosphatase [Microvirga sp.]